MKDHIYHPHRSVGLPIPLQYRASLADGQTVCCPKCPLSGLLIAPSEGVHVVIRELDKHGRDIYHAKAIYVHRWALITHGWEVRKLNFAEMTDLLSHKLEFRNWQVYDGPGLATQPWIGGV